MTTGEIPAWAKVEVDPENRRLYLNGSRLDPLDNPVSVDPGYGSLTAFSVSQTGSTGGRLFLDELHLRDPRGMVGAGLDLDLSLRLAGPLVRIGGVPVVSDLTLTQKLLAAGEGFSTLYGRPEERRRLSSRTEVSVSLPLVDLAAELQVQGSGSDLGLSGGHRLALPNVAFPVSFADSYRSLEGEDGRDLLRSNTLDLRLPGGSSMRLSSSASSSEGVLTQEWAGAAQARLPLRAAAAPGGGGGAAPADLAASARLGLRASADGFPLTGYPTPGTDYFTAWLQGYRLLLPWEEGSPLERKAELATEWRLSTRPLGVELDGRLSALGFDVAEQSRSLESAALWTLGFPILLGPGGSGPTLKPGYRRKVVLQSGESGEGGFRADADLACQRLGSQSYGWAFLPFQELFDPAVETAFADRSRDLAEALYVPEALLALERPFGSRLRDLLLPSRAQLGLAKEFRREADTVEFRNLWNLSLQSSAVNLFGLAGVRPLFRSYQSDEFGGSLEAALTTRGERVEEATLSLEQYASFEGGRGGS